ncbi:MAG TPA: hypothetical protein VKW76_13205 [Candidatus Binatia bacterium]|nr:hypothetical protein [Candidatus Binatia bacterium]
MALSRLGARTLRAAVAAIRPRGEGFDQPLEDHVLAEIAAFLPHLPGPMRRAFPLGLWLLELGPPLFVRRWRRFSRMEPDEAQRYLARLQEAGGLRGALVLGLRALVLLAFYQHPAVLTTLEVDWAGRAAAAVARRAELLDDRPA